MTYKEVEEQLDELLRYRMFKGYVLTTQGDLEEMGVEKKEFTRAKINIDFEDVVTFYESYSYEVEEEGVSIQLYGGIEHLVICAFSKFDHNHKKFLKARYLFEIKKSLYENQKGDG